METRTFRYKQADHSYEVAGEGPVVVLLHGFGEVSTVWNETQASLEGYRRIIPRLPGTGGSELLAEAGLEAVAEWLAALLGAEGVNRCVVIGHSMGGYIALALAEKYPALLAGLGLFHSTAYADSEEKKATRRKTIAFLEANETIDFLKTGTPALFSAQSKAAHPEWIDGQIEAAKAIAPRTLAAYTAAMMNRPDRTAVLESATVPVLFVLGREDSAIPLADGLRQCHLPRRAQVEILEASGHMGMVEEAGKAIALLRRFLSDCLP